MLKIVYFDEASALDTLDQSNNGRLQEITKEMVDKANELSGNIELEGKASTGIFSIFKVGFGMDTKGQFSRKGSNILTTTITNTILTNFLKLLEEKKKNNDYTFEELQNYKLSIVPETFTFLKTLTPFIKVYSNSADSKVVNPDQSNNSSSLSENNLDYSLFDDVIANAKGYYELLATKDKEQKIVRFNLDGLRNNYKLTDLQKMNLIIYGIKVGQCTLESLNYKYEIGTEKPTVVNTGFDALRGNESKDELEIIDVILAGIK
ncbi:hypothetical protein CD30_16380 [Ureibacillus massiliensis 4400831 = CIP 108448 = CCUG 49529]|uniref:Uncharacterized protein n=1 Tax=Ureibacillus massiliensis 4400831 = CIP 108448 = CCUG 49529 TaxID=1211035 RepID=A0A0A3J1H3_9BACL|nr:DUF6414 family protein [Ureibacillus massiliensis]KGR89575.1 hypothetical protein CD30_16380 [Ureibacillus massiliensis 4400831 = CIP 108448 = CCUG 49529]